jgi:plasmid stability protein
MATLLVEHIPDELYAALQEQSRRSGRSIAAEIVEILAQHVVTDAERGARQRFLERAERLRSQRPLTPELFPAEELQREDRER